ncbi:hypothetical protein F5B22DRAFT_484949 [Xylaria bambusicola]|uniref:uncharacterized protein n=1 Tax=Xylaria bambusicola TaxID=326684 RepID=UPI0020072B2B|nr:uncharacterized protein F5B22DRAFT_484949 [Xylaria bambusicola]KAI0506007.1 hypothetical protein F5B22DRAFT_484949 [Xylaria bambusicola]
MFICTSAVLAAVAFLVGPATAKTDIGGCVSTQTVAYGGASLIWYVPDTGEICEFLDCGGGRAPPKTTVPGCPSYEGTATYSPSYLPGFGATVTSTSSTIVVATESSASEGASSEIVSSPPVTKSAVTVTSSVPAQTQTDSSSITASLSVTGSSSSSVSTGGAALPTGSIKGPIGIMAGLAVGVAIL